MLHLLNEVFRSCSILLECLFALVFSIFLSCFCLFFVFFLHTMLFTQALVTSVANVSEELPQASVTSKG